MGVFLTEIGQVDLGKKYGGDNLVNYFRIVTLDQALMQEYYISGRGLELRREVIGDIQSRT